MKPLRSAGPAHLSFSDRGVTFALSGEERPFPLDLVPRLAEHASPGDIIVIHDGHHVNPRADRQHTVAAVHELIPALRARGLHFAALCDPPAGDNR